MEQSKDQAATPVAESDGSTHNGLRSKPKKSLPSSRITFSKQIDILRAYAAISGPTCKPVTNTEVSEVVKMHPNTVSLLNGFFAENGFLQRADSGGYIPSQEVASFYHAYQWNPEIAAHKMAPLLRETWFAKTLLPLLSFRRASENEAVASLADAVSAGPEYKNQLQQLIDYLCVANIVKKEGNDILLVRDTTMAGKQAEKATEQSLEPREKESARPAPGMMFAPPTGDGVVQFHISVKVDMNEFAGWPAERISAFFSGIAQVLAAKGAVDKT